LEIKGNALAIAIIKQNFKDFDLNTSRVEDLDKYFRVDRLIPFSKGTQELQNFCFNRISKANS
jgi:galactokinase